MKKPGREVEQLRESTTKIESDNNNFEMLKPGSKRLNVKKVYLHYKSTMLCRKKK